MGWEESTSYYSHLNATWAAALLTPIQVLQFGASYFSLFMLVAIFGVTLHLGTLTGAIPRKFFIFLIILFGILSLVSIFTYSIYEAGRHFISGKTALFISLLFGMSTIVTETLLIIDSTRHKATNLKDLLGTLVFIMTPSLWILVLGPQNIGQTRALMDINPSYSDLPHIQIVSNSEDWRLVGQVGDQLLLICFSSEHTGNHFILINPETVKNIYTNESSSNQTNPARSTPGARAKPTSMGGKSK